MPRVIVGKVTGIQTRPAFHTFSRASFSLSIMASTLHLRYWNPRLLRTMFLQLQRQQNTGYFCDVTLKGEGEGLSVHACLLAACSPYLAKLLTSASEASQLDTDSPIQTGSTGHILTVPGIPSHYLLPLVHYMYTSELEVTPTNVHGVLEAARRLQIPELEELRLEGGRLVRPELSRKLNRDCFSSLILPHASETGNGKEIFTKGKGANIGSRGKRGACSSLPGLIKKTLFEIKNPIEEPAPSTAQTYFQSRENYECAFQDSGTKVNVGAIDQDTLITQLSPDSPLIMLNSHQKREILISEHGADPVPNRKRDIQDDKMFKEDKERKEAGEQATKDTNTNIRQLSRIIKLDRGEKQDMPLMDENMEKGFKNRQSSIMNSSLTIQDSVLKQACQNKTSLCAIKLKSNGPTPVHTQSNIPVCPKQQRIVQSHLEPDRGTVRQLFKQRFEETAALQKDICVKCVIANPMVKASLQNSTVNVVKLQDIGSTDMNTKKILPEERLGTQSAKRDIKVLSQKNIGDGIKRDWCADEFEQKEEAKRNKTESELWWEKINEVESPTYAQFPTEQLEELVEQILCVPSPSSSEVDVGGKSPVPTNYVGVWPDPSSESDTEVDIL
ncbi:uncharacterized protein LOC108696306 isoform X1 [Xenopus laevis]|uniref:Uncharacterized protein LOC108696306 isoform X1 n=2 Tax=Xenopus laevis TaxID=8355 RepID=A0A8J0TA72_XENLA|nr:uncharacterized protein LOC108696306 isoform X1 [Xenopus laevis]